MTRPTVRSSGSDSIADAEIAEYVQRARVQARAYEALPALSAFQRRMDRYPTLSADAQNELAARHQAGREAQGVLDVGKVRGVAARKHRQVARDGEEALEYLVGSTFRLVLIICRELAEERYGREHANKLLPDLVAEANVALTEAAATFDPARCPAFHTYAARVVRDRVRMTLGKDTALKVPASWPRLKRIAAVRVPELTAELGRQPTMDEIRAALLERCMQWAFDKLTDDERALPEAEREDAQLRKLRKQGMLGALERLEDVLIATQTVNSLDAPLGDGGATLADGFAQGESSDLFAGVELDELRDTLMSALGTLSEREQQIIMYRHGFFDGQCWTYPEISKIYGVTSERIRQIEHNAIAKLRMPHAYYDDLAAHLPGQTETWD